MIDRPDTSDMALSAGDVRLAYTLNNDQPVRCTYISEEPLFYMDAPEDHMREDDEAFLFEDDLGATADTPSFHIDAEKMFAEQFGSGVRAQTRTLYQTIDLMNKSRFAAEMISFARTHGIAIVVADQLQSITYERMSCVLSVRAGLSDIDQILLLSRELRRIWQHKNGALLHPLLFHPDHAVLVNRIQAADLTTMMVRVAWELRLAGEHDVWNYLENNGYQDMTRSFMREASGNFKSLSSGDACAAAFEAWFLSERCRAFDRSIIQQMLADQHGYVFKAGHEETSKVLTQQLIAALGSMPSGKNYLSAHASTILSDAIFTDVRDRANANFLWFIKFEQSFRQTERDLQQDGDQEIPSHETEARTATIIHLPVQTGQGMPAKCAVGSGQAIIVDLHGWRSGPLSD